MNVIVLYFGRLRELTEVREEKVAIEDNSSLAGLIEHAERRYGAEFLAAVNEIQGLRILINGREYTMLGGMDTVLNDGDTVVLLPPITGG